MVILQTIKKMDKLKEYLQREFRMNNHPKYYKYFEKWFSNLTPNQIIFYKAYMKGQKTVE